MAGWGEGDGREEKEVDEAFLLRVGLGREVIGSVIRDIGDWKREFVRLKVGFCWV